MSLLWLPGPLFFRLNSGMHLLHVHGGGNKAPQDGPQVRHSASFVGAPPETQPPAASIKIVGRAGGSVVAAP